MEQITGKIAKALLFLWGPVCPSSNPAQSEAGLQWKTLSQLQLTLGFHSVARLWADHYTRHNPRTENASPVTEQRQAR